jgi:hypothetical protein
MNIEEIPQIITAIQDDIKMLKSAINPKSEIRTDKELKVLLKNNTIAEDDAELKLEDIYGIIVPLLNGKRVLVYPKFKECTLLPKGTKWNGRQMKECDTLYNESDGEKETDELLALGSKAAEFVRNVCPGVVFNLPHNMLILAALYHFREEFNAITEQIEGASALQFPAWSSAMYYSSLAWSFSGGGYFSHYGFYYSFMCVPCVLYK